MGAEFDIVWRVQLIGGSGALLSLWTKNPTVPTAMMQAPSVFRNVSVRYPAIAVPVFTTVMSTEKTIPAVTPCLSLSFMRAWSLGRHTAEQYSWSCADRALPGGGAPGGCPRCIPHADPQLRRVEARGIRQERKLSTLLPRGCQPRRPSRSTKELVQQLVHDVEDVLGFSAGH